MANSNGSFGLKPIGKIGQATNSTGMTEYRIASDNSNPIFNGMAVIPLAGGVIVTYQSWVFLADVSMSLRLLVKRSSATIGLDQAQTVTSLSKPFCMMTRINCSQLLRLT